MPVQPPANPQPRNFVTPPTETQQQQHSKSPWSGNHVLTPAGSGNPPMEIPTPTEPAPPQVDMTEHSRFTPVPVPTQPTPPAPLTPDTPTSPAQEPRQRSEAFVQLNNLLKEEIGYSVEDLLGVIQQQNQRLEEFQPVYSQYQQSRELDQLRNTWGVDETEFRRRIAVVSEYSKQLPPEQIQQYDAMGYNGLDLLYRRIVDSQRPSVVPTFDRATSFSPPANTARLTEEQIMEQLKNGSAGKNWQQIQQHYLNY